MAITGDYQAEYNGIKIGDTTDYDIVSIDGLGMPDVRSADLELVGRDGLRPGTDRLTGRFFEFALQVDGIASNLDALAEAFAPPDPESTAGAVESALTFQIPGVAAGGIRRIMCRPRALPVPIGLQRVHGDLGDVLLVLAATDPLIYAETQTAGSTGLPSGTSGLSWPLTWPLAWGAATSPGSVTVTNEGNYRAGATLRVDGPVTNPKITNVTRDRFLEANITLGASDYLEFDTAAHTVTLNGTTNRYSTLTASSEWWTLAPGANSIEFRGSGGSGATLLTVTFRSAWIA